MVDLTTTNVLLGIIAAMSVIVGLAVIGVAIGGVMVYRKVLELGQLVNDIEARQIAPLRHKLDDILVDVKMVTARVSDQTERVDHDRREQQEVAHERAGESGRRGRRGAGRSRRNRVDFAPAVAA